MSKISPKALQPGTDSGAVAVLPAGDPGQVLTGVDPSTPTGLRWTDLGDC